MNELRVSDTCPVSQESAQAPWRKSAGASVWDRSQSTTTLLGLQTVFLQIQHLKKTGQNCKGHMSSWIPIHHSEILPISMGYLVILMEFIIPTAKLTYLYFINISDETPAMCKCRSFYSDSENFWYKKKSQCDNWDDQMFLLKQTFSKTYS